MNSVINAQNKKRRVEKKIQEYISMAATLLKSLEDEEEQVTSKKQYSFSVLSSRQLESAKRNKSK